MIKNDEFVKNFEGGARDIFERTLPGDTEINHEKSLSE